MRSTPPRTAFRGPVRSSSEGPNGHFGSSDRVPCLGRSSAMFARGETGGVLAVADGAVLVVAAVRAA
eukprot:6234847-Pyramimonas_sp.AAC.2